MAGRITSHGCVGPAYRLLDGWCPAGPHQGQVVITKGGGQRLSLWLSSGLSWATACHSLSLELTFYPHSHTFQQGGGKGLAHSVEDLHLQVACLSALDTPSSLPHLPRTLTRPFTFSRLSPQGTPGRGDVKSLALPEVLSPCPASQMQTPSSRKPLGLEAHQDEVG